MRVLAALMSVILMLLAGTMSQAQDVLLRVTTPNGQEVAFDRATLESLPQISFETSTIWTEGKVRFAGPALLTVLRKAGITAGKVELWALNDYFADLDLADLTEGWPIIATRRDGSPFGVRDNGPLWLVYPYDRGTEFADEGIYAASVWQLVSVVGLP